MTRPSPRRRAVTMTANAVNVVPLFCETDTPGHPALPVSLSPEGGGGVELEARSSGLDSPALNRLRLLIVAAAICFGAVLYAGAHARGPAGLLRPLLASAAVALGLAAWHELNGRLRAAQERRSRLERTELIGNALLALSVGLGAQLRPELELEELEELAAPVVEQATRRLEDAS